MLAEGRGSHWLIRMFLQKNMHSLAKISLICSVIEKLQRDSVDMRLPWAAEKSFCRPQWKLSWTCSDCFFLRFDLKYVQIPPETESSHNQQTLILATIAGKIMHSNRGMIVCLSTHLPCSCFDALRISSKFGTKIAPCHGCLKDFPVDKLKRCSRCLEAKYCSEECIKNDYPDHREPCKKAAKKRQNEAQDA